jgi:hypothetical protein
MSLTAVRVLSPYSLRDATGRVRAAGDRALLGEQQAARLAAFGAVEVCDAPEATDVIPAGSGGDAP